MLKAIIFDSYGTLINTGDGSVNASKKILECNGCDIDAKEFYAKWKSYHRKHIDSLTSFAKEEELFLMDLKKLYEEYGIKGNVEEDVKIMLSTLGIRKVFPDTLDVINELRTKFKVYIGSTSDEQPLISDIKKNGIVVDGVYSSESLGVYKPKKEFFSKILATIGMSNDEVLYVGDSLTDDILGPTSAGIKSVWINRKNQQLDTSKYSPQYVIINLYQLLEVLKTDFDSSIKSNGELF